MYNASSFCFNKIVPDYFSRIDETGAYSNGSGCGNDTAVTKDGYTLATQINSAQTPEFAYFNDTIRDGLKGSVFDDLDKGYASGKPDMEETMELLTPTAILPEIRSTV